MYEIIKDLGNGGKKNNQGIRNYQKLQADAYKSSNRTSGIEKKYDFEIKSYMDVLDTDKDRVDKLEERFEEITQTASEEPKKQGEGRCDREDKRQGEYERG